MKTARFLLACAVASVLAACGSNITAPDAQRSAPRNPSADEIACVKVLVHNADGTTSEVCVENANGSQIGSGY